MQIVKWLCYGLGIVLLVAAVFTISTPWLPLTFIEPLKNLFAAGSDATLVVTVVTSAGVLVALAGHLLTQGRNVGEALEKESRFYLDSCIQAYKEAKRLLKDGNNNRKIWIGAARALEHANKLSQRVSINAHLRVLEVHKLKYRGFFDNVLRGKPASFFYGAKDLAISTDEAAKLSSAPSAEMVSTVKALLEKSIHTIWEAAQFPDNYNDLLESRFSELEKRKLILIFDSTQKIISQ
jgi:hypothetical protein